VIIFFKSGSFVQYKTEVYTSAIEWMKWFQRWGIQTEFQFIEGPAKSTIVCTNENDQGPLWIFQRFRNDLKSFTLIVLTLLIA
jgi:hypothetical protein